MGEGIGGTDKKIGTTTTENECAVLVREKEPSANGATWGSSCYAEFGATGTNFEDAWQTCRFEGRFIVFKNKNWCNIGYHYYYQ